MKVNHQIFERMKVQNTLLCCGLDPDIEKIPTEINRKHISDEDKVFEFLLGVIDATAPHVCAFKAQKAFFDVLSGGHEVLRKIIVYIHTAYPGIPVIVDCKIGDIENTMTAYIHNLFNLLEADGIVVNPYMGDDAIMPLIKLTDKSIVILVKTSNKSGGIIQDTILKNGEPFWYYVLNLVVNRWNNNKNVIPVISSTVGLDMTRIRSIIPDEMPILFAGIGAQGGNSGDLHKLLNSNGIGVFVNSSRNILYPQSKKPWRIAVREAAVKLKEDLNKERRIK